MATNGSSKDTEFLVDVGKRLRQLREDILNKSPEDIAALTGDEGITGSYLRRVEKGEHAITIERLQIVLRAMGSNLGLFFEYMILESETEAARQVRVLQRIVRRMLEGPDGKDIEQLIRTLARAYATPVGPE